MQIERREVLYLILTLSGKLSTLQQNKYYTCIMYIISEITATILNILKVKNLTICKGKYINHFYCVQSKWTA